MDQVLADTLTANLKSAQAVLSAPNALPRQDPRKSVVSLLKGRTCDGHSGAIFPN